MDDDSHRRLVKEELVVQAARLGAHESMPSPERVYEALQAAARDGHSSIVKELLRQYERKTMMILGRLLFSGECGSFNMMFFECNDMPRQSHKTWYFYGEKMLLSPLHLAVKEGHEEVVEELISFLRGEGALLENTEIASKDRLKKEEAVSKWFQGLVEWAVRWGHANIVKKLLLTAPDEALLPIKDVVLPLHLAVHLGHLEVLKILLQLLPHTKLPSLNSEEEASSSSPSSQEALHTSQLQAAQLKKSLSCFSEDGLTALHVAAQCGCLSAVQLLVTTTEMHVKLPASPDSFTSLSIAKMDVNSRSSPELFTPLHMAASSGHVEVVRFLLQKDGNPSTRDCMGRTALHYAAREGHEAVALELLRCKLGIESHIASMSDYDGLLPLHIAAKGGHVEVIRTLRGHDEINSKSKHSLDMRKWVERVYIQGRIIGSYHSYFSKQWRFPRPRLIDAFFWRTEGFTPLHFAARYGHDAAVKEELLQQGSDVLLKDSRGFSACDWMEVKKQADALMIKKAYSEAGAGSDDHHQFIVASSLNNQLTINRRILEIASDINEEKQGLEELQHAWETGNPLPIRARILQWLMHDSSVEDYSECSTWHTSDINVDALSALVETLKHGNFSVAKEILLLQPGSTLDARLSKEVKNILRTLSLENPSILSGKVSKSLVESFLIILVTKEGLIGASNLLRWLLPWAKEKQLTGLVDVILDRPELKRGLYEDRQVFLDCANALLVGAALIAGVAFQGWLQPPLGYGFQYEDVMYADVHERAVQLFWWFNNGAFFLAVGSLIAGAKGAVPVAEETDIVSSLAKVRRAVAVASMLLGAALVFVVGAFTAAGIAVLPPLPDDRMIMYISVSGGATICGLCLLWFADSVWPLIKETISYTLDTLDNRVPGWASSFPSIVIVLFLSLIHNLIRGLWRVIASWALKMIGMWVRIHNPGLTINNWSTAR